MREVTLDYIHLCCFCCWTCKHQGKANHKLYLPEVYLKWSFEDDDSSKLIWVHTGSRVGNALPVRILVLPLDNARPKLPGGLLVLLQIQIRRHLNSGFHWLAALMPVAIIPDFHKWKSDSSSLCFTGWIGHKVMDWLNIIRQPGWKWTCLFLTHIFSLNTCLLGHLLSQWVRFFLPYCEKDNTSIVWSKD